MSFCCLRSLGLFCTSPAELEEVPPNQLLHSIKDSWSNAVYSLTIPQWWNSENSAPAWKCTSVEMHHRLFPHLHKLPLQFMNLFEILIINKFKREKTLIYVINTMRTSFTKIVHNTNTHTHTLTIQPPSPPQNRYLF